MKKTVAVVCIMAMIITFCNIPTKAQALTTNQQIILQKVLLQSFSSGAKL